MNAPLPSGLRILVLIRKWTLRGGNERVAADLARFFWERGHQVSVCCQKSEPSAGGVLPPEAIHRVRGVSFDPGLAMLSYAHGARRYVRRLRTRGLVDVVFGFNHSIDQDVFRLGAGTHREYLELARRKRTLGKGVVDDAIALGLEKLRFSPDRFRKLIAPSFRVRDELMRHYGIGHDRVAVLHNGVDLVQFSPEGRESARATIRGRWGVGPEAKVALFVGHELERKGFWLAAAAARRAKCRLVYVGRAARPPNLEAAVIWDGEQTNVADCYRAADAFLLPSYYDPFGGVVLEAYASGLPVVATRRIGATELASGTPLDSLLVDDPENVETLADRLQAALEPARRAEWLGLARTVAETADRSTWRLAVESVLRETAGMSA